MKCLNTVIPDRTTKEWHKDYYQNNKEKYQLVHKQYYQDNKEHLNNINKLYKENNKEKVEEYQEEYRNNAENKQHKKEIDKAYKEANKETIKEKRTKPFSCECGCTIQWDEKARHRRSKKHQDYMQQNQTEN
jgi:RecA-family ATPase